MSGKLRAEVREECRLRIKIKILEIEFDHGKVDPRASLRPLCVRSAGRLGLGHGHSTSGWAQSAPTAKGDPATHCDDG